MDRATFRKICSLKAPPGSKLTLTALSFHGEAKILGADLAKELATSLNDIEQSMFPLQRIGIVERSGKDREFYNIVQGFLPEKKAAPAPKAKVVAKAKAVKK